MVRKWLVVHIEIKCVGGQQLFCRITPEKLDDRVPLFQIMPQSEILEFSL